MDPEGTFLATGSADGELRVGASHRMEKLTAPASGPRGLGLSHRDRSPRPLDHLGGGDGTVRLWPMPDLSKPPLHTLPREELIAKLRTLTNLRVMRDEDSPTGWNLDLRSFSRVGPTVPDVVIEEDFEFRISDFGFPHEQPCSRDGADPG